MSNKIELNDKIAMIRAQVRAAVFLILVACLCAACFMLSDVRELVIAYMMGAASAAGVFYFEGRDGA